MTDTIAIETLQGGEVRRRAWLIGAAVWAVASAVAVYSAYGDPDPKSDQQHAVPVVVVVMTIVTVIVFGVLVPRGVRALREERAHSARWAVGHSVAALVLTPVVFWSGISLVIGAAGIWLGQRTREQRALVGSPTRPANTALVVGSIAVVVSLLLAILPNALG